MGSFMQGRYRTSVAAMCFVCLVLCAGLGCVSLGLLRGSLALWLGRGLGVVVESEVLHLIGRHEVSVRVEDQRRIRSGIAASHGVEWLIYAAHICTYRSIRHCR